MQLRRVKYLCSPQRFLKCRELFRSPFQAFISLGFLGKRPFELTLASGHSARFSRSGRDHRFWDWFFSNTPDLEFTDDGVVQIQWQGCTFLLRPETQDFFIFQEIFIDNEYDLGTADRPLGTVIDLGANAGLFSCAVLGKAERVISVEAVAENYQHTRRNVMLNGGNPDDVLHVAVAARSGETLTLFHNARNSGGHSVDQGWSGQDAAADDQETVESISLADLLTKSGCDTVDLLKCDIEGSEYEAFLATDPAILKRIQRIVMEVHISPSYPPSRLRELLKHLRLAGFSARLDREISGSDATQARMLYAERDAAVIAEAA